jgi:hypothetical protein
MINTIGQTSKSFNQWIDTFSVKNMIDSIDRYYRYQTFNGSIKVKIVFNKKLYIFSSPWQKNSKNYRRILLTVWSIDRYYRFSVYWWFDGHRSEKGFMIDCRYYRSKIQKSLTDGSITSMKTRPKVSIDSIDLYYRYRSIADCAHLCLAARQTDRQRASLSGKGESATSERESQERT